MENNEKLYNKSIYIALRISFIALLLVWSFEIVKPFIMPVLWGIIISVAFYPIFKKLSKLLGNRDKLSSIIISSVALLFIIIPSLLLLDSAVDGFSNLATQMQSGSFNIPFPSDSIKEWPVIGQKVFDIWALASNSIEDFVIKYSSELQELAPKLLSIASGFGSAIGVFIISITISGALLPIADASEKAAKSIFITLMGKHGTEFVSLSVSIIRSVVQGVLGVALIQALLAGIGFWAIGMPAIGFWVLIVFIIAILQIPAILVLGPLAAFVFTFSTTTAAIVFSVWMVLVGLSDNFLKPLLLGRGVDVPMLAILLGAIGGMMMSGIIGLFVGAVVLALSYKLFQALLVDDILEEDEKLL